MFRLAPLAQGTALAFAATLLMAAPGLAQEPPVAPPQMQQEMPPEVQAMLEELDATQEKLEGLQEKALAESEALQTEVAELQAMVEEAVKVVEPEYDTLVERFGALQQEAMAAQQAQDQEDFQEVMNEAQGIQMRLQTAQEMAFSQESVSQAVSTYQENLVAEMTRLDPETPELMERMDELVEQLSAILG